jgi:hypothetical protein
MAVRPGRWVHVLGVRGRPHFKIELERFARNADNSQMPTSAKKLALKRLKSCGKAVPWRKPQHRKSAERFDLVADLAERMKTAETVEVEAILAFHRTNSTAWKYWASKE